MACNYDPERSLFRRFKVLEFPNTFVGLAVNADLDLGIDITGACYMRTSFNNALMTFDKAREASPAHRAFTLKQTNQQTLSIEYKPTNECISKVLKMHSPCKPLDNRFIADLRAIKADGLRCCNDIRHSEIGRYYICGPYEYCKITHSPMNVDFVDVPLKGRASKIISLNNESSLGAKMTYIKVAGINVTPRSFVLQSHSSKEVEISFSATSYNVPKALVFNIRNSYDPYTEPDNSAVPITDYNCLTYTIPIKGHIVFNGDVKRTCCIKIESLQRIWEPKPELTYMGEDLRKNQKRKDLAKQLLEFSKSMAGKQKVPRAKHTTPQIECYCEPPKPFSVKTDSSFWKSLKEKVAAADLFDIICTPLCLDFGKVGVNTYGSENLRVQNRTKYDIHIKFLENNFLMYTTKKRTTYNIKIKSMTEAIINIICYGSIINIHESTFTYTIESKFYRQHCFRLEIDNPVLSLRDCDRNLKFGMTTAENFVFSICVPIYNKFNIPLDFEWNNMLLDSPIECFPLKGTVPENARKFCEIRYIPRDSKSKTHEINLTTRDTVQKPISVEVNIISKKYLVKFSPSSVSFKDLPLNLQKIAENIRLENHSREIVVFHVVEPILPGVTVEPLAGVLKPKEVLSFKITVQFGCVLEFDMDIVVKLNNKENVSIAVQGNVADPKLNIQPRNVILPRIPCGLITFIPVKFQNIGPSKSIVEVVDMGDENIFDVFIQEGTKKKQVSEFIIDPGQSTIVYVKVYDVFRRQYDQYLPFRINKLLGPPNKDASSTEISYYIDECARNYENIPRIKLKPLCKDIPYFRIAGMFTLPWIAFSTDNFTIHYDPSTPNKVVFTMKNISKYHFNVSINISKLSPNFDMSIHPNFPNLNVVTATDNYLKFELDPEKSVTITVHFHPQGRGIYVGNALFYLDSSMSIPFSNLTFIGSREFPAMKPSINCIAFPPCRVETVLSETFNIELKAKSNIELFRCFIKDEPRLKLEFVDCQLKEVNQKIHTLVTVRVTVTSERPHERKLSMVFIHEVGSTCSVEVSFSFTVCPVTLHADTYVTLQDNPYPYYPLETQTTYYNYLERCVEVLENWFYYIGFRRELYAKIPTTFHAMGALMVNANLKGKQSSITLLNYLKRIAGPTMKNINKSLYSAPELDPVNICKEIHNIYQNSIKLLRSRGAIIPAVKAKFLLTHKQFVTFISHEQKPTSSSEEAYNQLLRADVALYNRLTKQCWFDFLLQSYKVFILDSCFFECVCVNNRHRDIIKLLVNWYNDQISITHRYLLGKNNPEKPMKTVSNITTDLMDGVAIISALYNHCPFLKNRLSLICDVTADDLLGGIVHNTCIITKAMHMLKIYFPLSSQDFLEPNFLHMLMLSVHLYVTLPMFRQKCTVHFRPPLLRTSTRTLTVSSVTQESLIYTFAILESKHNSFVVERALKENGKKYCLNVKYSASFLDDDEAVLLVHGYNKTRIFDTYITFDLVGSVGALNPFRKCKVSAPLYRPLRVDISVHSPFENTAVYSLNMLDVEPTIPLEIDETPENGFFVKRLKLLDDKVTLTGGTRFRESIGDTVEHKVFFQMHCLNTLIMNFWVLFRSEIGEFFIKVMSQPRWDVATDTQYINLPCWPLAPCSCGEDCACYRSTIINIPHRNDLMLRALRSALADFGTSVALDIFDKLVASDMGKAICLMLFIEGGTHPSEVVHILRPETSYHIFSKSLLTGLEKAKLRIHSDAVLALPVTIPPHERSEKYTITLTSECNMDIRNYRLWIVPETIASNSCSGQTRNIL